jgi:hypothetical protein
MPGHMIYRVETDHGRFYLTQKAIDEIMFCMHLDNPFELENLKEISEVEEYFCFTDPQQFLDEFKVRRL